ncbi:MAG: glycosyltransferase family 4 protein [Candidatus Paceibacterota bacterium]|jgi:glycosyltransferase involved in cell wall biosynthesis
MKILFIQPTGDKRGHYGIYTSHVCQELAKTGADVTLFTNKIYLEKYLDQKPLFKIFEYKKGRYGFEKFDRIKKKIPLLYIYGYLRNSFVAITQALKYIKRNDFDVVFVMDTEYGILSSLLKFYSKKIPPLVLMVQAANFSFSKFAGNPIIKIYKTIQKRILQSVIPKKIKAFTVLGEFHKEKLQKQLGLKKDFPIKVIYDGADQPKEFLGQKEARKKINIEYEKDVLLFFGMLRKDKGIEYLLEAISLLKKEEFKLVIAGSLFDYNENDIKSLVKKFGIEDRVILRLGYVDDKDVPLYFFSSDVVVFPYRKIYTGGSGPLLKEAAIYKKPVISSNVSEMGRLVKNYKMGIIVEPENVHDLAEKIKEFLALSEKEREVFANNAAKAANTWQKMGKEYLEFFEEIINAKN